MKELLSKKFVLNPNYTLYQDKDRILLTYKRDSSYKLFNQFIHPMHAILFSFFKGDKILNEIINDISKEFSISKSATLKLLNPFIGNKNEITIEYDGNKFTFPKRLLVVNKNGSIRNDIDEHSLLIDPPYNFKRQRLTIPRTILFVIGTKCITNCIYCYADRTTKYKELSLSRIFSIIEDAKKTGIRDFELSGGEVFLYKNWEQVVGKLLEYEYQPEISTKIPITNKLTDKLYDLGIKNIQISLDSINSKLVQKTLKVSDDYKQKMLHSLRYLDKKGIRVKIKMSLSKWTCTLDNLNEIFNFLNQLNNVEKCIISTIGYSQYISTDAFHAIKPSIDQVKTLSDFIDKQNLRYPLFFDDQSIMNSDYCNYNKFKTRSLCSGNVDGFVVLPDGKVTICEELYWNEDFILGDLSNSSIMEVWESERAVSLWALSQESFSVDNPCKNCQDFSNCRHGMGVCWKEVVAVYGKENKFYPDPRCPRAPAPINKICYDD